PWMMRGMEEPGVPRAGPVDPDEVPGAAAPRHMPPMRRRPPAPGEPTPRQASAVATAGLVLTVLLAAVGLAGVVWAVLRAGGAPAAGARRHAPRHRRLRDLPPAAPARVHGAGPGAHRPRRRGGPHPRAAHRRRRLPGQALQPSRAGGAGPGAAAAGRDRPP